MNDELMKASSQNIRIITENGVTLRGLVTMTQRKSGYRIEDQSNRWRRQKVDNQLDVKNIDG